MTTRFKTLALIGLCLSVILAGCGRKGDLDDPGAPATADSGAVDPADAPEPPPLEPQSDRQTFPLDFLIN